MLEGYKQHITTNLAPIDVHATTISPQMTLLYDQQCHLRH
jgi:hypothetical protein